MWSQSLIVLALLFVLMLILISLNVIVLLFLPIGVKIESELNAIKISYLFLKERTINSSDIASYGSTIIVTRSENFDGILVLATGGKKFLLSNFNLRDYTPILSFLEEQKIKFTGKENFKFFSYYTQSFRS